VLRELEACLSEHSGEYVRLIGIDPRAKRRVFETIIQRPDGKVVAQPGSSSNGRASYTPASPSYSSAGSNGHSGGGLSGDAIAFVRNMLAQGARIGTEHADARHFQVSSWSSCSPIQANRESDVVSALQGCLAEHGGEYVRMFGIDPRAKRRLGEIIIQRPNGKAPAGGGGSYQPSSSPSASSSSYAPSGGYAATAQLSPDLTQQVNQLVAQGCKIAVEFADKRRFQTSSWTTATVVERGGHAKAIAQIEAVLADHADHYVRIVGIDPTAKKRVAEVVVHRPNGKSGSAPSSTSSYSAPAPAPSYSAPKAPSNGAGANLGNVAGQVRQLLMQGCKISVEFADERRYKIGSWTTGLSIDSTHESGVMSAIQSFLNEHSGHYVRLIGVDPKVKRRVAETVIHKPSKG